MPRTIAIIGGAGAEGFGLASRLARAGARVRIGSRDLERARAAAARLPGAEGLLNTDAARAADVIILTVPLAAQIPTLRSLRESLHPGAVLVDATVSLNSTPPAGSAAQQAAQNVPEGVAVVAAFHTLSAKLLAQLDRPVDSDVLLCGDSAEAKAAVAELIAMLPGARAVDAGPLANARLLENLAALLIAVNRRYKVKESGVRITGLP
ncbi:MAG: NADPH-dependent F420 reductase [Acidobacteria bacterium]|nr:NADPH-dependent F420 reductase [Acidobacteriota bacterium]